MLPDKNLRCPATGFSTSCREIVAEFDCPKFIKIAGHDPNTGVQIDKHGCADTFMPLLLVENSQMQRQTGAAVESFRNEMAKSSDFNQRVLLAAVSPQQERLICE